MRIAMVSDAHLQGLDDPNQAALVALLDQLQADRLVLMGDIFHFWWGRAGSVDPGFVPVLAALHRCLQRGVQIDYIRGNHDFHLGPVLCEQMGIQGHESLHVTLAGRRTLLVHGDQADSRIGYRVTRRVLRGRAFGMLMSALGPDRAQTLGRRLAGSEQHHGGPDTDLLALQRDWAQSRLGADCQVVVLGHSHAPGLHELDGGHLVNLGDFVHHHTFGLGDEHGFRLMRATADGPVPAGLALRGPSRPR
jgi:UDP-2,3-diacylglucosamine hydrolase